MKPLKYTKRTVSALSVFALGSIALAPTASAVSDASESYTDPTYELLEDEGLNPATPEEQLESLESGDVPLSLKSDATPVDVIETEIEEDGVAYDATISYFEDGSYSRSMVEDPARQTAESGLMATAGSVSGCTSRTQGSWDVRTGCVVSWDNVLINVNFNADIRVMSGIQGAGQIDAVYNANAYGAGGNVSNLNTQIEVSNGNPARAVATFDFDQFEDIGGGSGSVALLVSNTGASVSVAGDL